VALTDYAPQYLTLTISGDIVQVRFKDERLTDDDNIEQLGHELFSLIDQYHCRKILLDLTGLKMMTSSVLGKMITLHRKLHREDGKLVVCNVGDYVSEILKTSRLHDYFNVAPSESDALGLLN
jgi:anti-sigma B factor antagonist